MIGWPLARQCADACLASESSQQPMWPHVAQRRRCTHHPPAASHSAARKDRLSWTHPASGCGRPGPVPQHCDGLIGASTLAYNPKSSVGPRLAVCTSATTVSLLWLLPGTIAPQHFASTCRRWRRTGRQTSCGTSDCATVPTHRRHPLRAAPPMSQKVRRLGSASSPVLSSRQDYCSAIAVSRRRGQPERSRKIATKRISGCERSLADHPLGARSVPGPRRPLQCPGLRTCREGPTWRSAIRCRRAG
jgi:hypothetical protein